jgi:hypothetical protein
LNYTTPGPLQARSHSIPTHANRRYLSELPELGFLLRFGVDAVVWIRHTRGPLQTRLFDCHHLNESTWTKEETLAMVVVEQPRGPGNLQHMPLCLKSACIRSLFLSLFWTSINIVPAFCFAASFSWFTHFFWIQSPILREPCLWITCRGCKTGGLASRYHFASFFCTTQFDVHSYSQSFLQQHSDLYSYRPPYLRDAHLS